MKLLRFLIIAICILYLFRYTVRLLLPFLFQSLIDSAAKKQQNHRENSRTKVKEGKTTIKYIPPQDEPLEIDAKKRYRKKTQDEEFIDYEEIK